MEPNDDELTDRELDRLLPEWHAPAAPARLRSAVFPQSRRPWWKTIWSSSIRVPIPALALFAVVLLLIVWRRPGATVPAGAGPTQSQELRPVAELRPVVIRSVK